MISNAVQPRLIADCACVIGENPLWHPTERKVYWTDIPSGRLFRYDPESGMHEPCYAGEPVGGFTLQADGSLLLFKARRAVTVWRDGHEETIVREISDEPESRFNDVIADPMGRVFCGTLEEQGRLGRLYRLDCDGKLSIVLEGIGCSNGMGFTADHRQMYYTDSLAYEIYIFDYDSQTGTISNRRVFAKIVPDEGLPDGMTVDTEGGVWSARWEGSCLVRYDAEGVITHRIEFPVKKVSSLTFGGLDYRDIYVTTAGGDKKETDGAGAGALFCIPASAHNFRGVPEFVSRVGI